MSRSSYLRDKIFIILLNGIGVLLLSLYLLAVGNNLTSVIILAVIWSFTLVLWLTMNYYRRRNYFLRIEELMENLDQPYLVQEFMEDSWYVEDRLYKDLLRRSNKAVIEQIYQLEEEQQEYREFIEGWIHEVKLPLTGIRLACHTEQQENSRRIEMYLTEVENAVDQALFYARSEQVYQDYVICETDIRPVILRVISRNKYLLIQNQMSVEVEGPDSVVYADGKWIEFILGQLVANAIKYKQEGGGQITIRIQPEANGTGLTLKDNGIGIPESEVGRVFEKGFTGSNGRSRGKATGIGLYLCRKLCRKLGLELEVRSVENEYTEMHLFFPQSTYLSKL